MYQSGFFEVADAYAWLDKALDSLLKLDAVVDWRGLKALMETLSFDVHNNGGKGGRPAVCGLLMAKILILQSCNNLADDATEFLINDRLSFKRFLGLRLSQKSPDAKTIWLWRERLVHSGLHEQIFAWFEGELSRAGYAAKGGQIVDATFVPTHKPTGKHRKQLANEVPLTPAQACQIDADATFTKKGGVTYHGYKNHTNIDRAHKLIRAAEVTTASLHESQKLDDLLDKNTAEKEVWADSAYRSEAQEQRLSEAAMVSQIHERAYRNSPLSDAQKRTNRVKSRVRARVEHVYGHMNTAMGGLMIHTLSLARAKVKVTLKNLAYNMQRFVFLQSQNQRHQCA